MILLKGLQYKSISCYGALQRGEGGKGQIDSRDSWGRSQLWQSHQEGLFVCAMHCIVYVQCKWYTQQCIVWCCVQHWDWEKGHKKDWQLGGSLLLRRKDMLCFFQCWWWPLKFRWCHKGFIQDHLLFNLSHLESWAGWRQKDSTASTGPFLCSKHELATIWMGSQRVVVSLFWSFKIYIKFCNFFWES